MENIYYKMMINNARIYLKNSDPENWKTPEDRPLNAFEISNVLAIVTGKLKEDIVIDLINGVQ